MMRQTGQRRRGNQAVPKHYGPCGRRQVARKKDRSLLIAETIPTIRRLARRGAGMYFGLRHQRLPPEASRDASPSPRGDPQPSPGREVGPSDLRLRWR